MRWGAELIGFLVIAALLWLGIKEVSTWLTLRAIDRRHSEKHQTPAEPEKDDNHAQD